MNINIQHPLENRQVSLIPLEEKDFDALYAVASDPEVWTQHPNKDRWKKEVFQTFFEGAMESKGAFKITDKATDTIIGSTRFYGHEPEKRSIFIGYTFYGVQHWGTGINIAVKNMMFDYIFQFVDRVLFHIGAENTRSQIAIFRLGARKIAEETISYHGETPKLNFVYEIIKPR